MMIYREFFRLFQTLNEELGASFPAKSFLSDNTATETFTTAQKPKQTPQNLVKRKKYLLKKLKTQKTCRTL